jgi:ubiquinone/menaquinone biosynthesis C-methylase UbiE
MVHGRKGLQLNSKLSSFAKTVAKSLHVDAVVRWFRKRPWLPANNAHYWSDHNVTWHQRFRSAAESLDFFHWRNAQYFNYIELMPVTGQDGKTVLDYGCGPGNDLVGFSVYSRPKRLIGMDVAQRSLVEAQRRLSLHADGAEFLAINEKDNRLSLEDGVIDYIHSSGVVHHASDDAQVLREFRRVLKPTGKCRVMVYNYPSVWLHLYVAYIKMIKENAFPGLDLHSAFSKTTDGESCPIARVYRPQEFSDLAAKCGFHCRFLGAAVSLFEVSLLPQRFEAIDKVNFPREHRDFLLSLVFDDRGYPLHDGHYAGIDGCYELIPA